MAELYIHIFYCTGRDSEFSLQDSARSGCHLASFNKTGNTCHLTSKNFPYPYHILLDPNGSYPPRGWHKFMKLDGVWLEKSSMAFVGWNMWKYGEHIVKCCQLDVSMSKTRPEISSDWNSLAGTHAMFPKGRKHVDVNIDDLSNNKWWFSQQYGDWWDIDIKYCIWVCLRFWAYPNPW